MSADVQRRMYTPACSERQGPLVAPEPFGNVIGSRPDHNVMVQEIFEELSYDSKGNRLTAPPTDKHSIKMAERAIALLCSSDKDVKYFKAVRTLVTILAARYEQTEDPEDLNKAISTAEKHAFRGRILKSDDFDTMWSVHEMAAELYAWRFHLKGNLDDINFAISHMHAAEQLMKNRWAFAPDDAYALMLYNFGVTLYEKYCATGGRQDLNRAIGKTMRAVECAGVSNPDRASFLASLGRMLHERFDGSGALADLESAIAKTQEAINLFVGMPGQDDEGLHSCLMELANMQRQRRIIRSARDKATRSEQRPSEFVPTLSSRSVCARVAPDLPVSEDIEAAKVTVPVAKPEKTFSLSLIPSSSPGSKESFKASKHVVIRALPPSGGRSNAVDYRSLRQPGKIILQPSIMFGLCGASSTVLPYTVTNGSETSRHSEPTEYLALPWVEYPAPQHTLMLCGTEEDQEPDLCDSTTLGSDSDSSGYDSNGEKQLSQRPCHFSAMLQGLNPSRMCSQGLRERPADHGAPTSGSGTGTVASSTSPSSRNSPSSAGKRLFRTSERPKGGEDSDDEDEDDIPRKRAKSASEHASNKKSRRLKCPYYQRRPEGHSDAACRGRGFDGMAKLKDHLKRKHLQPIKCMRCWLEMPSVEARNQHLQQDPICGKLPEPFDERICASKLRSLNFNSGSFGRARSVEEKWRLLYQELFPDELTVPSPYELPGMNTYTKRRFLDIFKEEASKEIDPALQHLIAKLDGIMLRTEDRLHHEFESASQSDSSDTPPLQAKSLVPGTPDIGQLDASRTGSFIFDTQPSETDLALQSTWDPLLGIGATIIDSDHLSYPVPSKKPIRPPHTPLLVHDMSSAFDNITEMQHLGYDLDSVEGFGLDSSLWAFPYG